MAAGPRDRLVRVANRVLAWPIAVMAQRILDRFGAVDGPLLAAGIAYNAVFALIPLALLASGIAGLVLSDPQAQTDAISAISNAFPPLAGLIDPIIAGLAQTSPSATIIGLILAGWGTSRMFASLERAIVQLETTSKRRGFVKMTARRIGAVLVVAGILLIALLAAPVLTVIREVTGESAVASAAVDVTAAILPPALGALALTVIYRVTPIVRPTWWAILTPAIAGGLSLYLLTLGFVFFAPRVFAGNVVYGTLGAILVGLVWLDLVFTVVLMGAAWVVERAALVPAGSTESKVMPPPV